MYYCFQCSICFEIDTLQMVVKHLQCTNLETDITLALYLGLYMFLD